MVCLCLSAARLALASAARRLSQLRIIARGRTHTADLTVRADGHGLAGNFLSRAVFFPLSRAGLQQEPINPWPDTDQLSMSCPLQKSVLNMKSDPLPPACREGVNKQAQTKEKQDGTRKNQPDTERNYLPDG